MNCPICERPLVDDFKTPKVAVQRCVHCHHRVGIFARLPFPDVDYYEKHGQAEYVDALGLTRIRQAKRIVDRLQGLNLSLDNFFDFGAGRAWFVRTLLEHGARNVAGGDSSDISLNSLEQLGATGVKCEFVSGDVRFAPVSFDVKTVSFLDVIEHFQISELNVVFPKILARFPTFENVVIKVPISDGLLYRTSDALRRLGRGGPIEQLFQVNTNIPHYHYFSKTSLALFAKKQGLKTIAVEDDPEVDDVVGRAHLGGIPKALARIINAAVTIGARIVGCDARIVFTKRS